MVRKTFLLLTLGTVLAAQTLLAQEEGDGKSARFETLVRVTDFELTRSGMATVRKPGVTGEIEVLPFKAYPYGSLFTLQEGAQMRIKFSDLTYVDVRGPAKFAVNASDEWRKAVLEVTYGDYNITADERLQAGQFTTRTPVGTFSAMAGRSKLHVGEVGATLADNFSFRILSGTARYEGTNFSMPELSQANTFLSADVANMHASEITGRVGEVKMDLPLSGDGKVSSFSLTPGATVKITRSKAPGSDNWTVSVLTLYANGEAKNYFAYVENRGDGFYTGELIDEVFVEPEAEEDGEEGAEGGAAAAAEDDDFSSFDDGDLL